jgi:hypothetical protein
MFEEERPTSSPAAAGHAVLHRGGAHRLRRQLRAGGSQQLRRAPGAHRLQGAGAHLRAAHRDPRHASTQALLRTHARAERPGTVVLPMDERVFNPSRETRHILRQAKRHRGTPAGCASCCLPSRAGWASASCGASSAWPGATRPPGRQRLRAGPGARHLQLPARQGPDRAAGQRGAGGHRPRSGHAGAGRVGADPAARADPRRRRVRRSVRAAAPHSTTAPHGEQPPPAPRRQVHMNMTRSNAPCASCACRALPRPCPPA